MNQMERLVSLLLNPLTITILHSAIFENLYPSQIAKKIGKSKALVIKRLTELEEAGIIEGRFERQENKVVKRYHLAEEEVSLKINLKTGKAELTKKRIPEVPKHYEEKKRMEKLSELLK